MPFLPLHDDNPRVLIQYAWVTWGLIAVCSFIFLFEVSITPDESARLIFGLGLIPATVTGEGQLEPELMLVPPVATLVTAAFLHGGWMHLIGNMLFLWIFGNNVEDSMGHVRFVVFYVICGAVAVFAHALPNSESTIPMIGASGAISGVLGAYLLLYPHARVLVLIPLGFFWPTVRLPAMGVLGLWFLWQLISQAFSNPNQPGVAFGAHIGGFVAGLALIPLFKHRNVRLLAPPR